MRGLLAALHAPLLAASPPACPQLPRSWLGFWLFNQIPGAYAPRTQYVELFVSSGQGALRYPGDYLGLYLAMEHIEQVTPGVCGGVGGGYVCVVG